MVCFNFSVSKLILLENSYCMIAFFMCSYLVSHLVGIGEHFMFVQLMTDGFRTGQGSYTTTGVYLCWSNLRYALWLMMRICLS